MNPRYVGSKTLSKLEWVAVDLDNSISQPVFPKEGIGEPIEGAKEALEEIEKSGHKIVIYTARPWGDHTAIFNWLMDHQIPFHRIECGKLLVKLLIDDRAFQLKDWKKDIKQIKQIIGTI